jgi:FolB domain-containing protein
VGIITPPCCGFFGEILLYDRSIEVKMDKVVIKNILARGIIGIRDWERNLPQDILINIDISTAKRSHTAPDNISECIDYSKLTKKVIVHAETSERFTVEALAEDIAQICLEDRGC